MTNMTPASPTPASKPKPRPRPQVMKLTEAAAQRIVELTKRDLAQARYNVLLGDLRLRQASGTLTPNDLQQINGLLAH